MTAETVEIPTGEIQWEERPAINQAPESPPPEPPEEAEIIPQLTPPGKHRAAEDSADTTDEKPAPKRGRGRPRIPRPPKAEKGPASLNIRPPDFSEWHDYIGNFAVKWITRGFIAFAFRGIDRWEVLSDAENAALELDPSAQSDIAKPLAHFADRSKLGKKYGRIIIDSTDGITALIQLSMWGSRVNRIARRVRERDGRNQQIQEQFSGPDVPEQPPAPSVPLRVG